MKREKEIFKDGWLLLVITIIVFILSWIMGM